MAAHILYQKSVSVIAVMWRRRDLDNILKAPLDALTHAGLLIDDEQFDEINIVRGQLVPGGRLGIKITELECA